MYKKSIILLLIFYSCLNIGVAQNNHFNYFCGFENDTDSIGWVFSKRPAVKTNYVIGRAAHRVGAKALYVSADGGATAGYESTASGYVIVAYRKFTLDAGSYDLSFDVRIAGDAESDNDVLSVAYFPTTKPDGSANTPAPASMGAAFPNIVKQNMFMDIGGKSSFVSMAWTSVRGIVNIPVAGDYYVAFYFKEYGGVNTNVNPGPCIDNIQLCNHYPTTHCAAIPSNLNVVKSSQQIIISWDGNAPSYDLMYFSTSNSSDTTYTLVNNITANTYSIPFNRIAEGNYNFRVRALCPPDTSIWVELQNFLVYDPSAHCLDYLNFNAEGVSCTSGKFDDPYETKGVIDLGPQSKESMHTVHYETSEYDRLTGYELKTVPDGALASVRLSNWTEYSSPSGSITYEYKVKSDAKVLLLRYAAVLQYASHHPADEQTRIHVEILDVNNNLLSHCTEADFNARDVAEGNTRGWRTYIPKPDEVQNPDCPIKWLDWSILGINLEQYVGQTVRIKLTLYACSADFHFGYAYFVLDCTKGEIEGMSCGEVPDHFTVSDGFDYKWYKMSDPLKTPVCTTQTFVPEVGDTCSYYVDLMYPENNNCKFTLSAYTLPRMPEAMASYLWRPKNCQNIVKFVNLSRVFIYPPNDQPRPTLDTISSSLWDFGEYGTSSEKQPTLVVPNEGDTFKVVLRSEFNTCFDYDTFIVAVPAIASSVGFDTAYICDGGSVVLNGKEYTRPGDYSDSTLKTIYGCDSVLNLHLEVMVTDTIIMSDSICAGEELLFFGQKLTKPGVYQHHVSSSIDCDSLYYEMNLVVFDTLDIKLGDISKVICADDESFFIPYSVNSGNVTDYSIKFDSDPFVHVERTEVTDSVIEVEIPDEVRPNKYSGTITFYNLQCDNLDVPFEFDVLYPSTIVTQRWNDVLAVINSKYNGGYTFIAYQWLLDGVPLEGKMTSQLYDYGSDLQFGHEYTVLLTRADDNITIPSCPFIPEKFDVERMNEEINVVFPGASVAVEVKEVSIVEIFNTAGTLVSRQTLMKGDNNVVLPSVTGMYIMRIVSDNMVVSTSRIMVANK